MSTGKTKVGVPSLQTKDTSRRRGTGPLPQDRKGKVGSAQVVQRSPREDRELEQSVWDKWNRLLKEHFKIH